MGKLENRAGDAVTASASSTWQSAECTGVPLRSTGSPMLFGQVMIGLSECGKKYGTQMGGASHGLNGLCSLTSANPQLTTVMALKASNIVILEMEPEAIA